MKMNSNLFDSIINTAQDCVFWKDKERRFFGANQAFLDFYGFDSVEEILGKTDEDMGWHSNPEPFRQDELRVLQGESTYKVPGKCMIRGEERDILASKRPIYDNGEIVGLVGSFMDVTDVMRRHMDADRSQILYSAAGLRRYPFFDKLLDELLLEELLDPLTGVISRAYILDFVKTLIATDTKFTFVILDLDNFKYFNDTYGHHTGDQVLMNVARELADFTSGYGVVGRFGGDELLLVNLRDIRYNEKKRFFEELYEKQSILRKSIHLGEKEIYVTGTTGCASYPEDAEDYETLFSCIDKALYRGKKKGRNCYVIYVDAKYKDLEIASMARRGIYTNMQSINIAFESASGFADRLRAVMPFLKEEIQLTDLYYCGRDYRMHSVFDPSVDESIHDIDSLMKDPIFSDNSLEQIRKSSPVLYSVLNKRKVEAVLIVRIGIKEQTDGYLICAEPRSKRIWQEEELGILFYLASVLAVYIRLNGDEIPE